MNRDPWYLKFAVMASLVLAGAALHGLWAQGTQGTLVGIPFGPSIPLACNPSQPQSQHPLFYLTQSSAANNIGLNYCIAVNQFGSPSVTIAKGTAVLGTSAITNGACAAAVTVSASGVLATDHIEADFNADPTSTTGYAPGGSGILVVIKYPTAGNVNFKVCNNTTGSITPGAVTLNWRVLR